MTHVIRGIRPPEQHTASGIHLQLLRLEDAWYHTTGLVSIPEANPEDLDGGKGIKTGEYSAGTMSDWERWRAMENGAFHRMPYASSGRLRIKTPISSSPGRTFTYNRDIVQKRGGPLLLRLEPERR